MRITSTLCVAAVLAGIGLTADAALADTWRGAYDATIVSTYADGRVVKVYVDPHHTYSITLPDGAVLRGTWADADTESCFTLTDPPPAPDAEPTCFPLKEYRVGDTFAGEDSTGAFTGVIQAGR